MSNTYRGRDELIDRWKTAVSCRGLRGVLAYKKLDVKKKNVARTHTVHSLPPPSTTQLPDPAPHLAGILPEGLEVDGVQAVPVTSADELLAGVLHFPLQFLRQLPKHLSWRRRRSGQQGRLRKRPDSLRLYVVHVVPYLRSFRPSAIERKARRRSDGGKTGCGG